MLELRKCCEPMHAAIETCVHKCTDLYRRMSLTHPFSFLEYAVAYHVDVPKRSSQLKGDYSMMEYKFVFEDKFLTGRLKTKSGEIARLQGGAGLGKAAFAVATHEKKPSN